MSKFTYVIYSVVKRNQCLLKIFICILISKIIRGEGYFMKKVFAYVIHIICVTFILFIMQYLKYKYHLNFGSYLVIAIPALTIVPYFTLKNIKANK